MKSDLSREQLLADIQRLRRQVGDRDDLASRFSAMSKMAAELVHELNQPLIAIHNYAQAIQHAASQGDDADLDFIKQCSESIDSVSSEARDIIGRLRAYLRPREINAAPLHINDVVLKAVGLFKSDLQDRHVTVDLQLSSAIGAIEADAVQIEQIVVNLFSNALEAITRAGQNNGQITVRTGPHTNVVQVSIADNGPGIPSEFQDDIFQPFRSSKSGGLGLGLANSQSIVKAHQGRIWHESIQPHGACFHFTLPKNRDSDTEMEELK